ncbi:DUF3472 domain-containing protein [Carboxylicivirga sediminis]|uniref:DUF3472 domain-containing protein n=1 Tax=Carboxylicivirga sediminis TaxID=2006564 RepID=A0A941F6R0_9BACT|nr:DUF3472 domain-containing protein [Carboxylicivirga sediminis]MBR8536270.1 DUF3472 domain-containing protein [Carboxylicivirga sediminis]
MQYSKQFIAFILSIFLASFIISCDGANGDEDTDPQPETKEPPKMLTQVPAEGNSWFLTNVGTAQMHSKDFKGNSWSSTQSVLRTYFHLEKAGTVHIGIKGKVVSGTSTIEATFQGESKEVTMKDSYTGVVYIGSYEVASAGYYHLDLKGIKKVDVQFAELDHIALGGDATSAGVNFSNEDYFYWGRRGPSVHLGYQVPTEASDVQWFYSEVQVPEGNDVIGSYYMANGFGQGYFGMQVNSSTERRVLFSVWSPYHTDDPNSIPEDQRVKLISKGELTITNDFGNEGSGGQSYMVHNWEVGRKYGFLLRGEPAADNKTEYKAYFFDSKDEKWYFIAHWSRPETSTYLTNLYSFLENFNTATGPLGRMAFYGNQWVYDTTGKWYEVTSAKFTADATARDKARMDYAGGYVAGDDGFYLKNCGFFSEVSTLDVVHNRPAGGTAPVIDFDALPLN